MTVSMTTVQQVLLDATEKDAHGNSVMPAVPLDWSADNAAAVAMTPAGDGMSCLCVAQGAGDVTITVTDSQSGLSASEILSITQAPAVTLEVAAGTVTDVPAAPAA